MRDVSKNQWLISRLAYPPTHEYEFSTLQPKGVLAERFSIINSLDTDFFNVENFLDIGANKGFFSQIAMHSGAYVAAIEPDAQFHELLSEFEGENFTLHKGGFKSFASDCQFDSVWIGNTHHYLERESPGYVWVLKLAALIKFNGVLIIEGPTENSPDVPADLLSRINEAVLIISTSPYFTLLDIVDSPTYTPGRKFWRFQRITPKVFNINEIKPAIILKPVEIDSNNNKKMAIIRSNDVIVKTHYRKLDDLEIMSLIISNGQSSSVGNLKGLLTDRENNIIGWLEPFLEEAEREIKVHFGIVDRNNSISRKELLVAFLERTTDLAKLGYVDIDSGMSNWIKYDNKLRNFDKNSCWQIGSLSYQNIKNAYIVFQANFELEFGIKLGDDFVSALLTRNAEIINKWATYERLKLMESTNDLLERTPTQEKIFDKIKSRLKKVSFRVIKKLKNLLKKSFIGSRSTLQASGEHSSDEVSA